MWAKLNDFPHAFHQRVEILGLSVATSKGGDHCHVVIFFISLDDNSELPR
jgi:hypothetical protein